MRTRKAAPIAALMGGALGAALLFGAAIAAEGCGGDSEVPDAGDDAGGPLPPSKVTLHPDAAPLPGETECTVVITTGIPVKSANHVGDCVQVKYDTNPPSGGNHWPFWGAFKKYSATLPREMYVHDMEHGAVILLFNCEDACPEVEEMLGQVFDAQADPLCLQIPAGPVSRMIITRDPLLDKPIAASAWGATYTATCIDRPSLMDFVKKTYSRGTENFCADGKDIENGFVPCGVVDAGNLDATDDGNDANDDAGDGG